MRRLIVWIGLLLVQAPLAAADFSGELIWARVVDLGLPGSGRIETVAVAPGAAVTAGQELLTLDARAARAQLAQARSVLKEVEQQRAEARREWDRAKEMFDRTVLSERELQLAEIGYLTADAHYQTARATLVQAEVQLDDGRLTAPFDGWVVAVHVAPGQAVSNRLQITPLIRLAERGRMRVRVQVDAAQAAALGPAVPAEVRVGDRRYAGKLVQLALEPAAAARPPRYSAEIEFALDADQRLPVGADAEVTLP